MALFDKTSGKPASTVASKKSKVEGEITYLKVELIFPNKYQPRSDFDDAGLTELADSIREHGILQPLAVTLTEDESGYYVIAGERRLRAAKMAGLTKVPTIIREVDNNQEIAELSLIENVQREDLNPMDAARAYVRLMKEFGLTQEEIAKRTGKDQSSIAKTIKGLSAPQVAIDAVDAGVLSMAGAVALVGVSNSDAEKIIEASRKSGASAKKIEQAAKQSKANSEAEKAARNAARSAKKSALTGENMNDSYCESSLNLSVLSSSEQRAGLVDIASRIVPLDMRKKNKAAFCLIFDMLEKCDAETGIKLSKAMLMFFEGAKSE